MKYVLLLWPYANGRYEEAMRIPAAAELEMILFAVNIHTQVEYIRRMNAGALTFEWNELTSEQLFAISHHSLMFLFGIWQEEQHFIPLCGAPEAALKEDLASVQKYKGKTNERFTQFLINAALYSGKFANCCAETLQLLDPMCGRGTTLFQAVNRGWNAFGLDADKKEIAECNLYFEKYLQFHHFKHKKTTSSHTIQGKNPVALTRFEFHENHFLTTGSADAVLSRAVFGRDFFHLIVCDLPYGVQHAPSGQGGKQSFENTLQRVLPEWKTALKTGGTLAISYNTFTLKTQRVRELLKEAGFEPMTGGPYDKTEHWVEQAVVRDISVAKKV